VAVDLVPGSRIKPTATLPFTSQYLTSGPLITLPTVLWLQGSGALMEMETVMASEEILDKLWGWGWSGIWASDVRDGMVIADDRIGC
jgi:hypothetical protein